MAKALLASVSASRRSLWIQRLRASSPTVTSPQQTKLRASRDTARPPARARAISTCMTRGCSRMRRPPATTSHAVGRISVPPIVTSGSRVRSIRRPSAMADIGSFMTTLSEMIGDRSPIDRLPALRRRRTWPFSPQRTSPEASIGSVESCGDYFGETRQHFRRRESQNLRAFAAPISRPVSSPSSQAAAGCSESLSS